MLPGMKQYSVDLRERLLGAIDAGLCQAEAARLVGVGTATSERWRQRERGSVAPRLRPGRPRRISPLQGAALTAQVEHHPEATLAEHGARWEAVQGVRLSPATRSRAWACRGWPLTKSP